MKTKHRTRAGEVEIELPEPHKGETIDSTQRDALAGFLATMKIDVRESKARAEPPRRREIDAIHRRIIKALSGSTEIEIKRRVQELPPEDRLAIFAVAQIDPMVQQTQLILRTGKPQMRTDIDYMRNEFVKELVDMCRPTERGKK